MRQKPAPTDRRLAEVAARQHGVISTQQLRAVGLDDAAIRRRVAAGHLYRVHRGAFAVGKPKLTFEGRCLAAALSCGPNAVVSHRSAAAVWGFLPPHSGGVHVSLPGRAGRSSRPGLILHRPRSLPAGVRTRRSNVPVTDPTRTLRDLKRAAGEDIAQRAFRRALDLRLVGPDALGPEPDLTRSKLERRFLALCRRHRLPLPEVNARVGPYEVDFLWRREMLIVETDSWQHHGHRAAFESDRAKDARLQALGYRILRFTWRQIEADPRLIAGSLRAVLRTSGEGPA